ncbi:hypothetical protein [Marinobacterium aestuariivivens]|uniref:Uncharacterized protein n=1 Tax=Marinobacterium aestuariivivens TaxID=1698799 RepID=A0ABW1ZZJ3_9GAMM
MNTSPVTGTALIRPLAIDRIAPRGPLLCIRRSRVDRLGAGVPSVPIDDSSNLASIDWVHMRSPLLDRLRKAATLSGGTGAKLERLLDAICRSRPVPEDWASNVRQLLRIPEPGTGNTNSGT